MSNLMDFHFLRPAWLLALLLLPPAIWWWRSKRRENTGWGAFIQPALLAKLQLTADGHQRKQGILLPALACCLALLSLAGPAWEKLPTPVLKSNAATVFILDLSPSMLAQDLRPSRIVRARQKLTDALQLNPEGLKALVVYAGEAHLVTPLTDDARTILSLVPSLDPRIMPLTGSNIESALRLALQTLQDGQVRQGRLVLLTDGISPDALAESRALLSQFPYPLHIISIGDETGAPIPVAQGFAKNADGTIVMASNERALLRQLAGPGRVAELAIDNSDIDFLRSDANDADGRQVQRDFDQWHDRGYWLAWLLLPLGLLLFRRNLLYGLAPLLLTSALLPRPAQAMDWQSLWRNDDQRGQQALQQGDAQAAAEAFRDPRWKAQAHYQAGQYPAAARLLEQITQQPDASADDWYNRANAEAQAGRLDQAIESYQQALAQAPDMTDAQHNKAVVEQLRDQQQNQQQNPQQDRQQDQQQNQQQNQQNQQNQQQQPQNAPAQSDNQQNAGQPGDGQRSDRPHNPQQDGEPQAQEAQQQAQADPNEAAKNQQQQTGQASENDNARPEQTPTETAQTRTDSEQTAEGELTDATAPDAFARLSPEEQQAVEQWLRRVPDDPAALLREKFKYQYHQRQQAIRNGEWQAPDNDAHQRW